jgi:hypothetical protein
MLKVAEEYEKLAQRAEATFEPVGRTRRRSRLSRGGLFSEFVPVHIPANVRTDYKTRKICPRVARLVNRPVLFEA